MANGKHSRLRTLNKINTTLRKNNKTAFNKGVEAGIKKEIFRISSFSFIEKLKFIFFGFTHVEKSFQLK